MCHRYLGSGKKAKTDHSGQGSAFHLEYDSREAIDLAGVRIDVDVIKHRACGQSWHGRHCAHEGVDETGANRGPNITDGNLKTGRRALLCGIRRERQMGLRHADGQASKSLPAKKAEQL